MTTFQLGKLQGGKLNLDGSKFVFDYHISACLQTLIEMIVTVLEHPKHRYHSFRFNRKQYKLPLFQESHPRKYVLTELSRKCCQSKFIFFWHKLLGVLWICNQYLYFSSDG